MGGWQVVLGFNPCFNGFMDKDQQAFILEWRIFGVSTLVLMDSWIKTLISSYIVKIRPLVSTLVLMDSWIKTTSMSVAGYAVQMFQPLF